MLDLVIILIVASFIIIVLLNVFFAYIPIDRIEKTAKEIEPIAVKLEQVGARVDNIINQFGPKLEMILDRFCQLDASLC